jgi:hypothetical protein
VSAFSKEKTILMSEEDIPRQTDRPPIVRSAGLPILSLTALRCVRSTHEITELARLRTRLGSEGAELAEALFPVIGTLAASPVRPVLVGLRRALHQSRTPTEREWSPQVASVLPAALADRIGDWAHRLSECGRRRGELPAVLAEEQRQERARLREALMHPGLQRALSQSAPTLWDEARRWIADERRTPQRQKLFRLAKYVSRAAAKTSPYSTFMISSFGTWGDTGPAIRFHEPREPHGVLELNGHYLEAVRLALARRAELARGIRVRVNPSATQRDGELRFLGVRPAESIVTLTVTPALRACLSLFDHGVPTMAGLRERWRSASGAGQASDRFLDRLVAAGLLEPYVPVSDHAEDWLGQVQEWVERCSGGRVPQLVKVLGQVRDELHRDVPVADVEEHRVRQRALHTALGELADTLELDRVIVGGSPGAAFHEVAVAREPVAVCSREQWAPALHDLDVLRRFLAIFDRTLPLRLAMGSYVRERFGSGARVELIVLHSAVQQELVRAQRADPPGTDAEADLRVLFATLLGMVDHRPRLARLRHLQRLRAQARELLLGEPDGDGVVRVDPGALSASVASRPAWITAPAVVDCYVQARSSEAGLGLVLNVMTRGHGQGSSRLRRFVTLAGGLAPPDECDSHGRRLAELSGMLGWTLNVRAPSVRYEIDYPFTVSTRPGAERLPLSDLTLVHDPATDLVAVHSTRLGCAVTPLHLSALMEPLLPPAARLLTELSGELALFPRSSLSLMDSARTGLAGLAGPVHRPRVQVGRVVVRRASWEVAGDRVALRAKGESDADYLLRLRGWLQLNGIPGRCFVRTWGESPGFLMSKSRKPIYVDFASSLLVGVFEREVRDHTAVVFEEVLPALEEAPARDEPAVTELVVEVRSDG